jgi:hypothetical protein
VFWCLSSFLTWVSFHHLHISIGINYYWKLKNYDKWIPIHPKCNTLVCFHLERIFSRLGTLKEILVSILVQNFWRLFEGLGFLALSNSWISFYGMGVFTLCEFGFVLFVLVSKLLFLDVERIIKACVQGI